MLERRSVLVGRVWAADHGSRWNGGLTHSSPLWVCESCEMLREGRMRTIEIQKIEYLTRDRGTTVKNAEDKRTDKGEDIPREPH